jgi:segregation and condensation protein B
MIQDKLMAIIEAILFLESEIIDIKTIRNITKLSGKEISLALEELAHEYGKSYHGLELQKIGGGWVLIPKKELWDVLRNRYGKRNKDRLSRAALETLSIIAYSQPITRAEIESMRGVSSDSMVRLLLSRNLIKEVGRKDVPGRPAQYGTTKEFLLRFKLNSIADLPKLSDADQQKYELKG